MTNAHTETINIIHRPTTLGTKRVLSVCVFVRSILATVSPSGQGETCATLCSVTIYVEDYTCSVYFSVQLEPTEVTQEGVNTGLFSPFYILLCPTSLLRCLPTFLSREGSGRPFPLSTMKSRSLCTHEAFQLLSLSTSRYESEKKPSPAEIRTRDLGARRLN